MWRQGMAAGARATSLFALSMCAVVLMIQANFRNSRNWGLLGQSTPGSATTRFASTRHVDRKSFRQHQCPRSHFVTLQCSGARHAPNLGNSHERRRNDIGAPLLMCSRTRAGKSAKDILKAPVHTLLAIELCHELGLQGASSICVSGASCCRAYPGRRGKAFRNSPARS